MVNRIQISEICLRKVGKIKWTLLCKTFFSVAANSGLKFTGRVRMGSGGVKVVFLHGIYLIEFFLMFDSLILIFVGSFNKSAYCKGD